jgi:hypothetical protein
MVIFLLDYYHLYSINIGVILDKLTTIGSYNGARGSNQRSSIVGTNWDIEKSTSNKDFGLWKVIKYEGNINPKQVC